MYLLIFEVNRFSKWTAQISSDTASNLVLDIIDMYYDFRSIVRSKDSQGLFE